MVDSGEYRAEADLLHPLATFHWEHCNTCWSDLPTHCAVLHDKVVILTERERGRSGADVLHISSTDLYLWSTTTLPYKGMSLTTYQSMFVAVGGCHPSTYEPTNLLFTSDTGLEWQTSQCPMPTKRYRTSSVSTRSPEVLVVAGGQGSDGRKLNVVELLLGDQWSTVNPLPAPYFYMHSTFHDGNLYFMGGEGMCDTVYTCNCTSLISSCDTNTTTNRQLWRQSKAPRDFTAAVSYSSRLVSIDGNGLCTIRAYSTASQSWVEATSTGDRSHQNCHYVAAAVLPTGELVCARADEVYKVKLSVSSFDPDIRFISNVLSRLEAVMGIQIVSTLADIHSQLMYESGVQLQGQDEDGKEIVLPDPQSHPGRYVEEVFSQWSAGRSHRPHTWRHLIEVLPDIGLQELSQQIDTFMKGLPLKKHPGGDHPCVVKKDEVCPHVTRFLCDRDHPEPVKIDSTSGPRTVCENNLRLFRELFPNLVSCLQPSIKSVADLCFSKNLVSEETFTSILELNMTSADKTRRLLMNIKQTISHDSNAIDKLCCILTEVGGCDSVVKELKDM